MPLNSGNLLHIKDLLVQLGVILRGLVDEDMIIVSPKGVINEELDQGDYFELVDMETESPDYHLYIKGRDMNQWMNQNGIRTKQLISGGRGQ